MPDASKNREEATNYGLSVDEFKAAVEAIVRLRDEGKLLVYYTRQLALRLIGDVEDIRLALAPGLTGDEAAKRASEVQSEIRTFAYQAMRWFESLASAARILEREHFEEKPHRGKKDKVSETEKQEYQALQLAKLEIAAKVLVTEQARERIARMGTSTGPCLEDLDYELIQERLDSNRQQRVEVPFLRLRLRYTDIQQEQYLGGIFSFGGPDRPSVASSFELECDLSDIDLLIKRLSDAKQRLIKVEPAEGEAE